jgi:hypothetical protein
MSGHLIVDLGMGCASMTADTEEQNHPRAAHEIQAEVVENVPFKT